MQYRIRSLTLPILAVLALSVCLFAQTARLSEGTTARPDLSGIWQEQIIPGGVPAGVFTKEEPPMLPWAIEKSRIRNRGTRQEVDDPSFYPYCIARTFPRVYNFGPSIEILPTADRIYMIFEHEHQVRRIFMDGKKHLEGLGPTWLGTSYGRWDGDTLIVETDNINSLNGNAWFDREGHPFTDRLRVTERIRRPTQNTLRIDFIFEDPGTFVRPWTATKILQLKPDHEVIEDSYCETHHIEDFLRDIETGNPRGQP
jgi:hypothetical protein